MARFGCATLGVLSLLLVRAPLLVAGVTYPVSCDDVHGPSCGEGLGGCTAEESPDTGYDCYCGDGVCSPIEEGRGDRWSCPADCEYYEPYSETATLRPKYYILTVIYSPPGSAGGTASYVTYESGETVGSKVTATKTFKEDIKVTASASMGVAGDKVDLAARFQIVKARSQGDAVEIRKKDTTVLGPTYGPNADGIDHDQDTIWLWLNPAVDFVFGETTVDWGFNGVGPAALQWVYAGWLKDPSRMPPGVARTLADYGITADDYPGILAADPLASGAAEADRYEMLDITFPYEPPYYAGGKVPLQQYVVEDSETNSHSSVRTQDQTVGFSVAAEVGVGAWRAKVAFDNNFTWSRTRAKEKSTGTAGKTTVAVGGPSYGYTGPTLMGVYRDQLYGSYMFAPVTGPLYMAGRVTSQSGQSVAGREIAIVAGGRTYRTFTNADGEYRLVGPKSGVAQIRFAGATKGVSTHPTQGGVDLIVP